MFCKRFITGFLLSLTTSGILPLWAQDGKPDHWHHQDTFGDLRGISTEQAYDLLRGIPAQKVIVAVIDTGVDYAHEDLKEIMWVNADEVPNNGIDDDKNGYIDDVHGWNFLGNASGFNINQETLEETRIFASGPSYPGDIQSYARAAKAYQASRENAMENLLRFTVLREDVDRLAAITKRKDIRTSDLQEHRALLLGSTGRYLAGYMENVPEGTSFEKILEDLDQAIAFYTNSVNYYYNPQHDPRAKIQADDSGVKRDAYGNADVKGPDASHGTHVAGIIAAVRGNKLGIDGIADHVRLMAIRVVPDGDERDQDVANAIYYAVDNGAKVINMSFGKAFSWDKRVVDQAVRYARRKDVLLIHAAGNGALPLDGQNNFPNPFFEQKPLFSKPVAENWIEVGASTYYSDQKLAASFSNFGQGQVDLFAPGYQIKSTLPENTYGKYNGTSMACPMVTGVAALLRSYFPKLSASAVKRIILESATRIDQVVERPSDQKLVSFKELSRTGAILNAANAVALAKALH